MVYEERTYTLHPGTVPAFLKAVAPGVADGSIVYREHVCDGLETVPQVLIGILRGANFGKVLLRLTHKV